MPIALPARPLILIAQPIVAAMVMLAALMAFASPARADLRVCNESSNPVSIALGYRAERGWQSEGWWVAPPGQCATVFQGDLNSRFYYLYVADDIGGVVAFLCPEAGRWVNAQRIEASGGIFL